MNWRNYERYGVDVRYKGSTKMIPFKSSHLLHSNRAKRGQCPICNGVDLFLRKPRPPVKMLGDIISSVQPTQMGCRIDFDSIISISEAFILDTYISRPFIGFIITLKGESRLEFFMEIPDESVKVSWEKYISHYPWYRNDAKPFEGPYYISEKYPEKYLSGLQEVVDYYSDLWEKIKIQGKN